MFNVDVSPVVQFEFFPFLFTDSTEDLSRFLVHPHSAHNILGQASLNVIHLSNLNDKNNFEKYYLLGTPLNAGCGRRSIRGCIIERQGHDGTSI
jgi:hypothetical protein